MCAFLSICNAVVSLLKKYKCLPLARKDENFYSKSSWSFSVFLAWLISTGGYKTWHREIFKRLPKLLSLHAPARREKLEKREGVRFIIWTPKKSFQISRWYPELTGTFLGVNLRKDWVSHCSLEEQCCQPGLIHSSQMPGLDPRDVSQPFQTSLRHWSKAKLFHIVAFFSVST